MCHVFINNLSQFIDIFYTIACELWMTMEIKIPSQYFDDFCQFLLKLMLLVPMLWKPRKSNMPWNVCVCVCALFHDFLNGHYIERKLFPPPQLTQISQSSPIQNYLWVSKLTILLLSIGKLSHDIQTATFAIHVVYSFAYFLSKFNWTINSH